jgi:hypothetical protein
MAVFTTGCDEGIDPITSVAPGPDEAAPAVNITFPNEGTMIRVKEDVTPLDIKFEVTDDIELQKISLVLDGSEIATFIDFNDYFKDYRRALGEYEYEQLGNGIHTLTVTATDLTDKSTSKTVNFEKVAPYQPQFDGEIFYMPFNGDYMELVSTTLPTVVGTPGFAAGQVQSAYKGAADAYLTFPTTGLLNTEFSATFWFNVNASPDRAGILVIGPPDPNNPNAMNNRTNGFRIFREGSATSQTFKLNVGNGTADSWFDGGAAATLDPATAGWVHMAFTISSTEVVVYFNGQVVSQGAFSGVGWSETDILSIASGVPRFVEWGHLSDQSLLDELRLYNKALTQAEIQAIMAADQ